MLKRPIIYYLGFFLMRTLLRRDIAAKIVLASFALLVLVLPHDAAAATRTAVNATSTSNNASSTLAKTGDIVSFQLNLDGGVSATNTPVISVLNLGTTTMTGTAGGTVWLYSTTSTTGWPEGNVTFTMAWMGSVAEATSTLASTASSTIRYVSLDRTAPTLSAITITSNNASTTLAKADDVITLYATSTEYIGTPTVTLAAQSASVTVLTPNTAWKATYTVQSGDTNGDAAISFAFADGAGNSGTTVTAVSAGANAYIDTAGPSISVSGSNPHSFAATTAAYSDAGATATDTHDGSTSVSSAGTVTSSSVGTYTITYTSTDTAGNTSTATRTVTVNQHGSGGTWVGSGEIKAPTLPGAVPPQSSSAQTESDRAANIRALQMQVRALQAQIAALKGGTAAGVFTKDLRTGMLDAEVQSLQAYLNARGYAVTGSGPGSVGNETTYFGPATKAALVRFQQAVGISPASGYFGPKTRAYIAANP